MKFRTLHLLTLLTYFGVVSCQRTILDDKFSLIFRHGKDTFVSLIKPRTQERNFKTNLRNNKLQRQFSEKDNFFCDVRYGARSAVVPKSVHKLTPGDIDIVGAIGDSLTAGNGAFATNPLHILLEGRGVSWSIGGEGTWRSYITLPNILKVYNPNLYGYSINEYSNSYEKASRFNVAEAGAMSQDTVSQAKNLVKRMRSDKNVDMKNHWKLVTHLIGGNDFCLNVCYYNDQNKIVEDAANDLILVLRILKQHLPRTLVNIVLTPDVSITTRFKNRPDVCKAAHYLECPCMFSPTHIFNRQRTINTIELWKKRLVEVTKMPEFHDTDDFEVNVHPFLDKGDIPRFPDGNTDLTYMSQDCFHLSQKGHATAANALWNSMLTPESKRLHFFRRELEEFKCPTSLSPYLATTKNR
ncbi:phospholipase B1, membrane-associated-like [Chironomus tepperi]|uniref:phospholipase B1, membrane-associated-like n=1 Tax=Chironomus tepperi TaxID=113505 RepID=UPI00391F43F2